MIAALNTAATGMEAQQILIDIIANNLANVNTNGFKRSRGNFQDLLYRTVRAAGTSSAAGVELPTGLQIGQGTRTVSTERLFGQGQYKNTQAPLDVAIEGNGFFQVQSPNGEIVYTRDGSFKTDAQGQVVTSEGYLLDPAISIPQDATSITIGEDGTVSVTLAGQTEATEVGQIQLASFVNPAGLEAIGRGFFRPSGSSGQAIQAVPGQDGLGSLSQGFLETSNVKVVEEMIDMIAGQRAYEINSKVIQTADQMLRNVTQIR
ncbi:MAG: flagellar basal-body rod protein FlgG [Myxococcales bacterium]|nr:MAG: flagellar basal-body rod protein FlgG [Myxococcales bacterium]